MTDATPSAASAPFQALADPTRRSIVEMLADQPMPAGAIASRFAISKPAVSQHLKTRREAALVRVEVQGQQRIYSLDPAGMGALEEWFEKVRRFWLPRLDALERELRKPDAEAGKPEGKGKQP